MKYSFIIFFILIFAIPTTGISKCAQISKQGHYNKTPIFVEGLVINANFTSDKIILKRAEGSETDKYPRFQIEVLKVLKGELDNKILNVEKKKSLFNVGSLPYPIKMVKNGIKRVFGIKLVDKNANAEVYTSSCYPIFEKEEIIEFLQQDKTL